MAKTILVCGYGSGISERVARRFGAEGFQVGLVARGEDKLTRGAAALEADGIRARGFVCDLADPVAVQAMIAQARAALGPITVLHWNAYTNSAGDLTVAEPQALRQNFDVAVTGLVAAVQAVLDDLRAAGDGAVLVTGGTLSHYDSRSDVIAARWGAMGLAVTGAAQHKLVRVFHEKLKPEGIYVGEVCVGGIVKGTAADRGGLGTVEAADVAARLWEIFQARTELVVPVP